MQPLTRQMSASREQAAAMSYAMLVMSTAGQARALLARLEAMLLSMPLFVPRVQLVLYPVGDQLYVQAAAQVHMQ